MMNADTPPNGQGQTMVELSGLQLSFNQASGNSFRVLDMRSLRVGAGEMVAVYGPSGSGKTTLLYVLAGLLAPDQGRVEVCGRLLGDLGEAARDRFRASNIGFIYQNFNLMQGFTALENVLLGQSFSGARPDQQKARELLAEVGLAHRLSHRPGQMSSGEQQRVAVARALINQPKLILADEPTASLHPANKQDVLELLLKACERHGCTLVLVTHETEILKHFSRTEAFLELNQAQGKAF